MVSIKWYWKYHIQTCNLLIFYLNPWSSLRQHLLGMCLFKNNGWFAAGLRATVKVYQWARHFSSVPFPNWHHHDSGIGRVCRSLLCSFCIKVGRHFKELVVVLKDWCCARRRLVYLALPALLVHQYVFLPTHCHSLLLIFYLNPWSSLRQHLLGMCLFKKNGWFAAGLRATVKVYQWARHFSSVPFPNHSSMLRMPLNVSIYYS